MATLLCDLPIGKLAAILGLGLIFSMAVWLHQPEAARQPSGFRIFLILDGVAIGLRLSHLWGFTC